MNYTHSPVSQMLPKLSPSFPLLLFSGKDVSATKNSSCKTDVFPWSLPKFLPETRQWLFLHRTNVQLFLPFFCECILQRFWLRLQNATAAMLGFGILFQGRVSLTFPFSLWMCQPIINVEEKKQISRPAASIAYKSSGWIKKKEEKKPFVILKWSCWLWRKKKSHLNCTPGREDLCSQTWSLFFEEMKEFSWKWIENGIWETDKKGIWMRNKRK